MRHPLDCYDRRSSEREHVRFEGGVEKLDVEAPVDDRTGLADQLVEALVGDGAVAVLVDVQAVSGTRRLPVDADPEGHGGVAARRAS